MLDEKLSDDGRCALFPFVNSPPPEKDVCCSMGVAEGRAPSAVAGRSSLLCTWCCCLFGIFSNDRCVQCCFDQFFRLHEVLDAECGALDNGCSGESIASPAKLAGRYALLGEPAGRYELPGEPAGRYALPGEPAGMETAPGEPAGMEMPPGEPAWIVLEAALSRADSKRAPSTRGMVVIDLCNDETARPGSKMMLATPRPLGGLEGIGTM